MFSLTLIIPLLALTTLDLWLLVQISRGYGIAAIAVSQVLTAAIGLMKIRRMDFSVLFFLDNELKKEQKIISELWEEAAILIAAVMLIIPGFLTDIIGGVFMIPNIRKMMLDYFQ